MENYENLRDKDLRSRQQYYYAMIHLNLMSIPEVQSPIPKLGTPDSPLVVVPITSTRPIVKVFQVAGIAALAFFCFLDYMKEDSAKATKGETSTTVFSDVRGIDEYRAEVQEIVNVLKNREKYRKIGARLPRGILLTGPPGTGKTLLAKAIAGEAGVKFFNASGSEFEEVFVGVGAKRIRELFADAKKNSPSIIFIDEIDAIGGSRKQRHSQNLHRQSLNQLLVEMDGFSDRDSVVVMAATNLPDGLDEALKRPGRFDKIIEIPLPDLKGREEILDLYFSKVSHDESIDIKVIAKTTTGLTGADLFNLVNMGMLFAIKEGRTKCTAEDIEIAKDRILLGIENKAAIFSPEEKYSIAIHEIGHVLTIINTVGAQPLHKTSILKRGNSYGKTSQIADTDQVSISRKQALANLDVRIGGKVMQELVNPPGKLNTQCEVDMVNASEYAHQFLRTGMFNELTSLAFFQDKNDLGPKAKNKVDASVNVLLQESYERVKKLLQDKVKLAKRLAKELVEKETLSKNEVLEIINNFKE